MPTDKVSRPQLTRHLTAGSVLLLAFALRFYRLGFQSLWSDEGNSIALAQSGFADIAARTALDIHPPFYYWLLKVWLALFGSSEFSARSLSAMLGVLLVAVVCRLGIRLFNHRPAGLAAAILAAINPFQVYYAQESRMYLLLALLGAMSIWLAAESWAATGKRQPVVWTGYALIATLGLYTQYAFPIILAAINVAALVALWGNRQRLFAWMALQLVPVLLYLPWLPIAFRQLTTWPTELLSPASAAEIVLTLLRYLSLGLSAPAVSDGWLVVFGVALVWGPVNLWRSAVGSQRSAFILLTLWLVFPLTLTAFLFRPAYLKFLLVASPAFCLLLGAAASKSKVQGSKSPLSFLILNFSLLIALTVPSFFSLNALYHDTNFHRDNYRGIAAIMLAIGNANDAVILHAPGQQEVFSYYYQPASNHAPVYPLPQQRPPDEEKTIAELERIVATANRIYAVYWATEEADPEGIIERWLNANTFKATDTWFGNVRLVSYATPAETMSFGPADSRFGESIRLTGAALSPSQISPGEILQVGLRWEATQSISEDYTVFVQLLDNANHLAGQRDAKPLTPTVDWQPTAANIDQYGLVVEPGTPPGDYRLIVGLYNSATGERLPIIGGADYVELGRVQVKQSQTPLPVEAFRISHPTEHPPLLGYDLYKLGYASAPDTPLHPGDPLHLNLYWQRAETLTAADAIELRLVGGDGVAQTWTANAAGVDYPMEDWLTGEIVRGQFDLFLNDVSGGDYRLEIWWGEKKLAETVKVRVER